MKGWTSKKSKKDKEKDKDKKSDKKGEKKEELPAPAKPALSISSAGGWAKSANRPDDAILALLKTECDKQIQGVSTERKTIAVIKKEEPPKSEEPKNDGDEEEFLEEGLVISGKENGKPIIKGGNIVKLVEFLTHHVHSDQKYMIAFMRTFRSFTTPKELLDLLIERFDSVDNAEKGIDVKTAKVIRLRVSNVFKYWLTNGFYDFEEDQELLRKLEEYIISSMLPALGSGELSPAVNLQKIIAKQKNPEERQKEREKNFSDKPPMPHLPKNINSKEKVVPILTYHPEELARQLTLIDYNLFTSIKPLECLNQNWMHKTHKEELAPNILAMIRRFNDVSTWVASEILKCKDLALRTKVLKQIIEIAEFCKNLNNFNTVMEIVSGLQSASVFRLKQTWGGLSKNYIKSFEEMRDIVSREKNYANFRSYLHNVNPPCIPYLGMYLTDLTFIEEGNKDLLPDGLINFTKRRRLSEVIAEIQTYQYTPYCLAEVSFIKEYLLGVECLPEEQCYKLSLKREARGGAVNNEEEQEEDEPFGEMEKISGYNFDEPDTDSTIIFEKDVSAETSFVPVSSANLIKLVERLTYHKYQDTDFVSTFLMALNKLTTPKDFFNLLEIRFNIPKPKNPSKQQLAQFTKVRLIPIHIRIYNVLKIWVNTYIEDFIGNAELINRVDETLNGWSESNKQLSNTVDAVKKIFAKKIADNVRREEDVLIGSLCDGTESGMSITQFEAEDLAKQLCLLEQAIFVNIKPRECLFISDPNVKQESSPTIYSMKKNFDLTKNWAASEFLKQTDLESRVKVLTLLIATAEKLVQIKNFNSSMSIIGGIKSIQNELENSLLWSYVSPSTLNIFKQLEQYYKNPSSLKPLEKPSGNPVPTLPFLDTYIKQLITIHDKPDLIQNLINFEKRRQQYEVFKIWNTFNQEPYSHDKTSCLDYLQTVKIFSPVEIRKKAESLERVAESKIIDKSRNIRADSIDGYDNSLSDSPRGRDEQKGIVKSSMISLISEEKDLIQEVISVAKKEIAKELMSELKKYTECVRDEIAMTNQQLGLPNNAEVAAERIILRIFPGALVVPVSEVDKEGSIFGWEEDFTLYQVDDSDDKWLIHITPKVLKPDLSAAFKIFELFKSVPGCADRQNVILTSRVTEEAKEIAGRFGVELLSFV